MAVVSWFIVLVSLFAGARGHARFVCPMPMNGNSGNKDGPCGSGDSGQYTVVAPGPMTVRFEETIYHEGAPTAFRLFRRGNTTNSCLLLDHMPHADAWARGLNCGLNFTRLSDFPVGVCRNTTAYVTVNIPDVDCDDCVLQLVSVMTDKYSANQTCVIDSKLSVNCSTYYSCANVKILGKNKNLDVCSRYEDNLAGSWPYTNKLQPGVYGKGEGSTSDFTPGGWLSALQMVWLESGYSPMTQSDGPCSPPSERYAAVFDGPEAVGAFSIVINDGFNVYVSGMLSEQMELAWLSGPGAAMSFLPQFVRNYSLNAVGTVPYNRAGLFIGTLGVQIKGGGVLTARLTPAVWTVSLRKNSTYYGEAVYAADGRLSLAIGNINRSDVRSLSINGPGKSLSSTVLQSLEDRLQSKGGVLWSTGTLTALQRNYSTKPVVWLGRAHVVLVLGSSSTSNVTIGARVPRPMSCEPAKAACDQEVFSLLPVGGSGSGGPNVVATGAGALTFNGTAHSFTLALENIRNNEAPTKVQVQGRDVNFEKILTMEGDDIFIVAGTIPWALNDTKIDVLVVTTIGSYTNSAPVVTTSAPTPPTSTTVKSAAASLFKAQTSIMERTRLGVITGILLVLTSLIIA